MNKKLIYTILFTLVIVAFFFKVIPIPVENTEGLGNQDKFIYGGIYWTSGLEQLDLGNYKGFLSLCFVFAVPIVGVYYIK